MVSQDADSGIKDMQLIVFRVGNEFYALDVLEIKEIVPMPRVTAIPNAPPAIMGIINLRGNVITVFSLMAVLGLDASPDSESKVIVVMIEDQAVGLVVNEVTETLKVSGSDVEKLSDMLKHGSTSYSRGVITLDTRLVLLLDTAEILEAHEHDRIEAVEEGTEIAV